MRTTLSALTSVIGRPPKRRDGSLAPAQVSEVLTCQPCALAYPVDEDVPVLLVPEALSPDGPSVDTTHPFYAEAYAEMPFYNAVGTALAERVRDTRPFRSVAIALAAAERGGLACPTPAEAWLDQPSDVAAHQDAYTYVAPVAGRRVLQMGGKGTNVIRMLVAGAAQGWLITPMMGEITYARAMASEAGVADRFFPLLGIAEELPLANQVIDVIFAGGTVHHMQTAVAFAHFARVLVPGGRFAAVEPWRAPLYAIGTRVFGKREPNPYCKPLTPPKVAPLASAFRRSHVIHHGTFFRYLLLVMLKVGFRPSLAFSRRLAMIDDRLADLLHLRRFGSCVVLLGES